MATATEGRHPLPRLNLPDELPKFGRRSLFVFRLVWFAALALAVIGPVTGTWYRLHDSGRNSAVVPGSRAGVALDPRNLTRVRYPVGPLAARAGIRPGDRIVAIDTIPVSAAVAMPGTSAAAASRATEADSALFGDLLDGAEDRDVQLRLRSPGGTERDVVVWTGETHIETGARRAGIPRWLLSFGDLLHLLTYPFLLVSAWMLYRRNLFDVVSSIVSLAILLTLATEQPATIFLDRVGVPMPVHEALYDLSNICLLAGILLFPHGRLTPRPVLALIAALPLLFFLQGDTYRWVLVAWMAASVATLLYRLRQIGRGDERQQLKWALFGFSGYAIFLAVSLGSDMMKLQVGSLGQQLTLELLAGLSFGVAFLLLQLGLLVALLKYRLYDAESVITRSASIAVIMLLIATLFEAVIEAMKQFVQNEFGQSSGSTGPVAAAALSTILINPVYERVQAWTERRFHRRLVELREDLPDCLRDLRHVATLCELLDEVFDRVEAGVRAIRVAAIAGDRVLAARGASEDEVRQWRDGCPLDPECAPHFEGGDPVFPIRVPLKLADGTCLGFLLIGPRPDCSSISSAELNALKEVARPVANALWLVLSREKKEAEVAGALARQQRQIEALAARLSIDPGKSAA